LFLFLLATGQDTYYKGIISELLILTAVFMNIRLGNRGYHLSLVLLVFSSVTSLFPILLHGKMSSISGVIVGLGTIVVCSLIHSYQKLIKQKMNGEREKNEELSALYEEITATEEELRQQNEMLQKYNQVITENEEKLNRLAYYDKLTGLPNRNGFLEKLRTVVYEAEKTGMEFAVIFIDLDNFKLINDIRGRDVGDFLLKEEAQRLKSFCRNEDYIGRLDGDEFGLILDGNFTSEQITEEIKNLEALIRKSLRVSEMEISTSASFGFSLYPKDGTNVSELMRCSDMAMYYAKKVGKSGIQNFSSSMEKEILDKQKMESQLAFALEKEEMYLVFQPQFELDGKRLCGFEALVRWKSSVLGNVGPGDFIPVAEKNGFIIVLGEWIIRKACLFAKMIKEQYQSPVMLAINISPVQIMDSGFLNKVYKIFEETGADPGLIEFEITESAFIASMDIAVKKLQEIKEFGVKIALDDFGYGYSSLNYLQMLPIDILKIDKIFCDAIMREPGDLHVAGPIIDLMHQMNLKVIAEGVEEQQQLLYLENRKCDIIQGYVWGKPLPEAEVRKLLLEGI
ncbi:MAG TPA: EAL domain-containing protein, partial [Lachnospiraceae bacterium]|nr:EAL domain-containing protein [Lachnospiraceae bacterium]